MRSGNRQTLFEKQQFVKQQNALVAFLLQEVGAREKLAKENAIREISRPAEREEGYAPSTALPFEKRKRASTLGENFHETDEFC